MNRWIAAGLWLGLVLAMVVAPPQREDVLAWVVDLTLGRWEDTEPWVVVHFMLMGVFPMLLAVELREHLRARPLPAWPFVAGMFALGGYALLPWFVLAPGGSAGRPAPWLSKLRVPVAVVGILSTLGLVAWAALYGSPSAWAHERANEGFVFVMAWDFLALWTTSVLLARARGGPWWLSLVPVLGSAGFLLAQGPASASRSRSGSSSASK